MEFFFLPTEIKALCQSHKKMQKSLSQHVGLINYAWKMERRAIFSKINTNLHLFTYNNDIDDVNGNKIEHGIPHE